MNISDNHAQAILDIFAVAVSDLVALGLSEDDAISGLTRIYFVGLIIICIHKKKF